MKPKYLPKLKVITIFSLLALLSAGCYKQDHELLRPKVESESTSPTENYTTGMTVGDTSIMVEVVNTDSSREQGLSKRTSISDKNGMLFDFFDVANKRPSFWMKDMNFAIDIIWINNGKIIGITRNTPAPKPNESDSNLETYPPPSDITQVLEVASGWAERNNLKVGDFAFIQI